MQRLEDVSKSGQEVGVTFALGLVGLMTRVFGEGCLGREERKVMVWGCHCVVVVGVWCCD